MQKGKSNSVLRLREDDASLKWLDTDYIDLYRVHAWDFTTPVEELMRALDSRFVREKFSTSVCRMRLHGSSLKQIR